MWVWSGLSWLLWRWAALICPVEEVTSGCLASNSLLGNTHDGMLQTHKQRLPLCKMTGCDWWLEICWVLQAAHLSQFSFCLTELAKPRLRDEWHLGSCFYFWHKYRNEGRIVFKPYTTNFSLTYWIKFVAAFMVKPLICTDKPIYFSMIYSRCELFVNEDEFNSFPVISSCLCPDSGHSVYFTLNQSVIWIKSSCSC